MPTITVRVDEDLKEQMDSHPEINWSEVTRQAIANKTSKLERLERLERIEQLTSDSQATEADVEEIAALIDEKIAQHYTDDEGTAG